MVVVNHFSFRKCVKIVFFRMKFMLSGEKIANNRHTIIVMTAILTGHY